MQETGGGGFLLPPRRLRRLLLLLCLPRDGEWRRRSSPPPDPGGVPSPPHRGSLTSTFQEGVATQQLQARGLVARPAEPLKAEAARRCHGLSFVGQRDCRGLGHPGATS
ncbi:unnamed protein product [Rangifer tarandus platyrhynchus]|uniref:Uncharacterized protein n=2 Tax=Rangifer tarandus platyrhynchus TaxID=3082113 RepID=A0AC60A145_RANTA|nr:unnamed protein product [Rangifer tarandus platyrhynchus]